MAEPGFGTGLNRLARARAARVPVAMTSFEAFPPSPAQMERAHVAFPGLATLSAQRRAGWGGDRVPVGPVDLRRVMGRAAETLPRWPGRAHAVAQDPQTVGAKTDDRDTPAFKRMGIKADLVWRRDMQMGGSRRSCRRQGRGRGRTTDGWSAASLS